jgi:hypothetical protein
MNLLPQTEKMARLKTAQSIIRSALRSTRLAKATKMSLVLLVALHP